jgi:DNA-binding CsgD family transcriptional regulator
VDGPADEDQVPKRVLDLLPERIALLDERGLVRWTNAAWREDPPRRLDGVVARAAIGESFLDASSERSSSPVSGGIRAVIDRTASHFELEVDDPDEHVPVRISATRLGSGPVAVIVKQGRPVRRERVSDERPPLEVVASAEPAGRVNAVAGGDDVEFEEPLTPRERQVLDAMMLGLDNHAIAEELGIAYTSVRAHVRSVIAKAGARSRLEVVARAYQSRMSSTVQGDDAARSNGRPM